MAKVESGEKAREKEVKASRITMGKDIKVIELQGKQWEKD